MIQNRFVKVTAFQHTEHAKQQMCLDLLDLSSINFAVRLLRMEARASRDQEKQESTASMASLSGGAEPCLHEHAREGRDSPAVITVRFTHLLVP